MRGSSGGRLISDKMANVCLFVCFKQQKQIELFVCVSSHNLPPFGNIIVALASLVKVFQQVLHAMEGEPKKQRVNIGKERNKSLKLIWEKLYLQNSQSHNNSLGSGSWRVSLPIHVRSIAAYLIPPSFPSDCS